MPPKKKKKLRLELRLVTEDLTVQIKIVEGMRLPDGSVSFGPSEQQYSAAFRLVKDLIVMETPHLNKETL